MADYNSETLMALDRQISRLERLHDQLVFDEIPRLEEDLRHARTRVQNMRRLLNQLRFDRVRARKNAENDKQSSP